ncbi:hypothetical protein [Hymenobacter metallicola]|uniref:Uncharacterized protein n=1 Tax=Hymenobacter metallicola TaxID=2563114 RepID=A0A4Z0QBV8_9BACT|nr:hypothetical protein [Hymenobacter metallicola]TGE27520.1 hypothetical protein E5K02_14190 [Hymenobacter metallicola]
MDNTTLGGWLVKAVVFGLQLGLVYVVVQAIRAGGGLKLVHPFQPGWGELHHRYASAQSHQPMTLASAQIGFWTYKNTIEIGFAADALVLRKTLFSSAQIRIPYAHITVVTPPATSSLLGFSFRTDGIFRVDGADISLPSELADQLLRHLAAAEAPLHPPAS